MLSWEQAEPAPVVLVRGAESLLAERAVDHVVEAARSARPAMELTRLDAADYAAGTLEVVASPSLFAEDRLIVVDRVEAASDAFVTDALAYLQAPAPDVVLVLRHAGGQRAKRLLDVIRSGGHPEVVCEPVTRDADKAAFVSAEFRRAARRIDADAVRALVDALGSDLRELAAACDQLLADTTGAVHAATVERYYGGRVEATGFRVADAAVEGRPGQAVALLRHALATGVDPVPLVAALAARLRTLARVAAVRGRGSAALQGLGMAPWQVDRARRDLARWTPEALAAAITAVAQADAEVKGAGRDPRFAVERAVLRVAQAAAGSA